jgi:rhodanese-related sulfurtransferase
MAVPQRPRAAAAALAVAALAACAHRGGAEPFTLVSIEETERMLARPGLVVIDANTPEIFQKHHLPGAVFWKSAPLAQLLPADRDRPVLFYCASPT